MSFTPNTSAATDGLHEHPNKSEIIQALNAQRLHELRPLVAYMSILSIVGVVGNILVIFIYRVKFAKSSSSYFVLCLAGFDLLTSSVGMPFDIIDMSFWYDFQYPVICKILRFTTYFSVMASSTTLVIVAFDRYYKVCKPQKRFSLHTTKVLIAVAIIIGVLFTWPAILIFGDSDFLIEEYNITSLQCSVETSLAGTLYPMMYYATLGGVFFIMVTLLIVVYSCLLSQLHKQNARLSRVLSVAGSLKSTKKSEKSSSRSDEHRLEVLKGVNVNTNGSNVNINENNANTNGDNADSNGHNTLSLPDVKLENRKSIDTLQGDRLNVIDPYKPSDQDINGKSNTDTKGKHKKRNPIKRYDSAHVNKSKLTPKKSVSGRKSINIERTTAIFFSISLVFILSYLPCLILITLRSIIPDFEEFTSFASDITYQFFMRSYFINNAVNPFIYGFLNPRFRKEVVNLVKNIGNKCFSTCQVERKPTQIDTNITDSTTSGGSERPPNSI